MELHLAWQLRLEDLFSLAWESAMGKRVSREKEEFWRLAIAEHEHSGVSAREFCRREGLSEPCFYSWRRKLRGRQAAEEQRQGEDPGLVPVNVTQSPTGAARTLRVAESSGALEDCVRDAFSALPTVRESVEIATPGGFVLRVREAIDSRRLSSLLQTLVRVERGGGELC